MCDVRFEVLEMFGYLRIKFQEQHLQPIKDEIKQIMDSNFSNQLLYSHRLVGNIKNEFLLTHSHKYIENLLFPHVSQYACKVGLGNDKNVIPTLQSVWVNFQKKHEFNPVHSHTNGDISFVIWFKIPYNVDEELALFEGCRKSTSAFQFVFQGVNGKMSINTLYLSSNDEYTCIIFPSWLHHVVYPFYTSDDYRISVAGNFKV